MLMLHHMFCVLLTITLLCVRATTATNQHTLSVPSNINNIHSYSLIQGKLLNRGDGDGEMELTPDQQKEKANEAIKEFEKIVTATNESIAEAEKAVEQAEAENIEAIKISEELQKIEGATEEEINASKKAYSATYNNFTSARGSLRIANEILLPQLLKNMRTAEAHRTSITSEGDQPQYNNRRHVSTIQSELSDANKTAKQIEKQLQEVMEKVQKVHKAWENAKSIKTQVESRLKPTPSESGKSTVNSDSAVLGFNDNFSGTSFGRCSSVISFIMLITIFSISIS